MIQTSSSFAPLRDQATFWTVESTIITCVRVNENVWSLVLDSIAIPLPS